MLLSQGEIEKIWQLQAATLPGKSTRSILSMMGVMPLVLVIPLLVSRFSSGMVKGCLAAAAVYLLYGLAACTARHLWHRSNKRSVIQRRVTTLLVLGFDGLSLFFLSLVMLSATVLGMGYLAWGSGIIATAVLLLYVFDAAFVLMCAPHWLRNGIAKASGQFSPSELRWIVGAPSGIVGLGVALGAIFGKSPYGPIVGVCMTTLGAFLLLPFGLVALYQTILMAWHGIGESRKGIGSDKPATPSSINP